MKIKNIPAPPYDIEQLTARVKSYADRRGCALTVASFHVFGDGERMKLLESGKTITVRTAHKAWATLDRLEAELQAVSA